MAELVEGSVAEVNLVAGDLMGGAPETARRVVGRVEPAMVSLVVGKVVG